MNLIPFEPEIIFKFFNSANTEEIITQVDSLESQETLEGVAFYWCDSIFVQLQNFKPDHSYEGFFVDRLDGTIPSNIGDQSR